MFLSVEGFDTMNIKEKGKRNDAADEQPITEPASKTDLEIWTDRLAIKIIEEWKKKI